MAGKFEPKEPVQLNPPKDDPITLEELAKCNGTSSEKPRAHQRRICTWERRGESSLQASRYLEDMFSGDRL